MMIERKKLFIASPGLVCLILFCAQFSFGQQRPTSEELKSLRKDVETIKESQTAIQKAVEEIKVLARAGQGRQPLQPGDIVLSMDDDPVKGDRNARLVLVEFSDYQCPFCERYFRETLPEIEKDYIKTGKLKYVFRDIPIEAAHKDAFKAAEAAGCAFDQGKFWEMHDRLFANQSALDPSKLMQYAEAIGLEMPKFQECLDREKYVTEVRQDFADGQKAGMTATPTFFLGLTQPNSPKVKVLAVIIGAKPYATFKEAIDNALSLPKQ
jgi:protein-disulfide isomerase